jgi:hypothetical protein
MEAVTKANAEPGANTIQLAAGTYLPTTTLTFTNTTGVQTVEGPTTFPGAKVEGGQVEPVPSELFVLKASVAVTFKNVAATTGGGNGKAAIDDAGTLVLESSTLAGSNGPGVFVESGATATVRNSTISDGLELGLVALGTASFFNSTVAFNAGGGVENKHTVNLTNTIVAQNKIADCAGTASTSDHSLDSDGSCGVTLSKMNPLLNSKLIFQGGSTPTHAIGQFTSPAHDAGNPATCTTVDQRGFARPDDAATGCDLGAVEGTPPTATSEPATEVKATTATANGKVNPNGTEVTECKFEYGTTSAYGLSAACSALPGKGEAPVAVSAALSGLIPGTTYHYRIVSKNIGGPGNGLDQTFTTVPAPTVITAAASLLTQTSATLNATVNPNGVNVSECKFEWGTSTAYGSPPEKCASLPGSGTSPVAVSAPVAGLTNKTTYHFRISATNASGTSQGPDQTFNAASTHAYKNGVLGKKGIPIPGIAWGTLKFTSASPYGEVECHTISAGSMENPTGGGSAIGKVQGYFAYECKLSEPCKTSGGTAIELTPENLPWSTEATEVEGGAFRLRTGNRIKAAGAVLLRVNCVGVKNTQFFAQVAPKVLNNGISIGSAPNEEEFDQPGSGELESEAGGLKLAGNVKFEGYGEEELIELKNP